MDDAFNGRTGEVIGSKADDPEVITSEGEVLGMLAASGDSEHETDGRVGQSAAA